MGTLMTTYCLIGIILSIAGVILVNQLEMNRVKSFFLHPFVFSLIAFFATMFLVTHQ